MVERIDITIEVKEGSRQKVLDKIRLMLAMEHGRVLSIEDGDKKVLDKGKRVL